MTQRSKQEEARIAKYSLWTVFIILVIAVFIIDSYYSSKDKSKDIHEATTVTRFEVDGTAYYYPID